MRDIAAEWEYVSNLEGLQHHGFAQAHPVDFSPVVAEGLLFVP